MVGDASSPLVHCEWRFDRRPLPARQSSRLRPVFSRTYRHSSSSKNLSLEELSQIEVTTVSKGPERAIRSAAAIYVITGDDIHRSGATTIPEVLRLAPGVEVARIETGKYSIGVRGFGSRFSRSLLVLIDGRTVYTTVFAGTFWEVQDTLIDDIDRIEVIRGPGGTIWGPNAVNGVIINIITKNSKETQGTRMSAIGGNEEQGFVKFRYGGGNGRNVSKSLQVDLIYRYVSDLPGQAVPAYHAGDARFAWRISDQLELSVVGRNLLQPSHAEFGGTAGTLARIRRSAYLRLTWGK